MKRITIVISCFLLAASCNDAVLELEKDKLLDQETRLSAINSQRLAVAGQPVNPNAQQETKDLWYYLDGLNTGTSNRLLSGQLSEFSTNIKPLDDPRNELKQVFDATGKWPAIIGFKYDGRVGPPYSFEIDAVNDQAIEYHNLGGIVHINANLNNPANLNLGRRGSIDINTLLSTTSGPGNANYDALYGQWDEIAVGLQELEDMKIPVMFRPYPEMNGTWFWWGGLNASPSQYKQLYIDLYNYFTNVKGLNNLLWIYEPSAQVNSRTAYYPGDAFIDIIGFSAFTQPTQALDNSFLPLAEYNTLKAKGKPIGFTQWGPVKNTSSSNFVEKDNMKLLDGGSAHPNTGIKNLYPEVVFWMSWCCNFAIHRHTNATQLMNDPWVIDRSEINIAGGGSGSNASVNNAGFEAGNLSGWVAGSDASAVSNNTKSGSYAAKLGTATSYGSIAQTVSGLLPNTAYAASAYIKMIEGEIRFKVDNFGGTGTSVAAQNTQYEKIVIPFRTGSANTSVNLNAWSSTAAPNSHGFVDDFSIEQAFNVKNNGFESGSLNNWTVGGAASTSSSDGRTGSYAASIGTPSSDGHVQQTITGLSPNTTYIATAYVKATSGRIHFRAENFGGSNVSGSTTSQSYEPLTVTFTTGPSNTSMTLRIWSSTSVNNSYGFADDVFLTKD